MERTGIVQKGSDQNQEASIVTDDRQTFVVECGSSFFLAAIPEEEAAIDYSDWEACKIMAAERGKGRKQERADGVVRSLPIFAGDRIRYRRLDSNRYEVEKLICVSGDPRAPFTNAEVNDELGVKLSKKKHLKSRTKRR